MTNDPATRPGLEIAVGEMPAGEPGEAAGELDMVPLDALAIPGEDSGMEKPEQGDRVSYTIDGTLERVEGDMAFIKRESVNGQPLKPGGQEPDAMGETPDNLDKLTADAYSMSSPQSGI